MRPAPHRAARVQQRFTKTHAAIERVERARRTTHEVLSRPTAVQLSIVKERNRSAQLRASSSLAVGSLVKPGAPQSTGDGVSSDSRLSALRPREMQVLLLYRLGLSTAEIADVFVISVNTVRTHASLALKRLGVHSRGEALALLDNREESQTVHLAYRRVFPELESWMRSRRPVDDAV
jgi:DNA-binding CsgD family transcriptional regulator